MPARRRSAQVGTLLATLLLAAGCGTTEPEPLSAIPPEVPADLCALVPEAARQGLVANASSDETGHPTAACSLRSADDAATEVRAVVTWLKTTDEASTDEVLASQCAAIDPSQYQLVEGFQATGADEVCAGSGKFEGADSSTIAAAHGLEVVTVRVTSEPPRSVPALTSAKQMLDGVLSSLAGES